ncbi:MAG: permease-like cell division protein FtsX [Proteobacteria bacterium]|nr:permease-like cell division protein FtsX [Pseudomonadota bacterium]MDE3208950.1 permease-like cell division protein FtsX [Pseudomonadota bacterium]
MANWILQHWFTFWQAFGKLFKTPLSSFLTILAMGASLCLPAGLYLILQSLGSLQGVVHTNPQISIFMNPQASSSDIGQVNQLLSQNTEIKQYRFIPKSEAIQSLAKSSGISNLLAGLPSNPLPDAFVVYLKNSSPENMAQFKKLAKSWASVDSVRFDATWVRRLHALLMLGQNFFVLISSLLGLTVAVVIGNTIRLQIATRHDEIEISLLIGATRRFIRRPFLYFGLIQGLLAGLAAWGMLSICLLIANTDIAAFSSTYGSTFSIHNLPSVAVGTLLICSSFFGWLGALIGSSSAIKNF